MASYNSCSNPCFDGGCSVLLADGTSKNVQNVRKGDMVACIENRAAEVLCILKTYCKDNQAELVEFEGGLLVTPYHPIRVNGVWSFPCDINSAKIRACPAVYSFVLKEDSGHVMIINGVECVTLGHSYDEEVVRHPYFGTRKVVDDLKAMRGWDAGLVEVHTGCLVRDAKSGLVCGIRNHDYVEIATSTVVSPLCLEVSA